MAARTVRLRLLWVWVHRWGGLLMAAFLVVVGLTGSLLAFNTELERVFAPQLFAKRQEGPTLDLATLAERAQALVPHARVQAVTFTEPDQVSVWFTPVKDALTGQEQPLGFTEFFVDPWTGRELGRRVRGDLSSGLVNLMPFIYEIHWTLLMDSVGQWTLGIVALLWSIDCLVSFYLTLPTTTSGFWRRWKSAWLVKRGASTFRLNFDLHRAGGLWVWALVFVLAWSSVMMNIRPVYEAVMRALFEYRSPLETLERPLAEPRLRPRMDWQGAQAAGLKLMAEQSALLGFRAGMPLSLMYFPESGSYLYEVRGSDDVFERAPKGGGTSVVFDGDTGELREVSRPTGERVGNTIESWLYALHMARVFGRPYQVFVCLVGLVVVLLSVTGVYIWLRKRSARMPPPTLVRTRAPGRR